MINEFAVDPRIVSSWERLQRLLSQFGFDKHRLIARVPGKWRMAVLESLPDSLSDTERSKIVARLRDFENLTMVARPHTWDSKDDWIQNVSRIHASENFALIFTANGTEMPVYTPPPPEAVPGLMQDLVTWLQSDSEIHPVLIAGIAQFELVHIHPFVDGNGRTSRLLSTLCMYRAGYDFKRLFTISEYYDRDRQAFYHAIQSVREQNMDLTSWLEFFTQGLATQLQETIERGRRAIRAGVLATDHQLNERQLMAIEYLQEHTWFDIESFELICPEITRRTLQRDLRVLVDIGILQTHGEARATRYSLQAKYL